ncbi:MAG: ATP synthase F1 subunit epsilon [Candidatus Aminicenantaceae bacterium]
MNQNLPSSLQLKIVTPKKILVETDALEVTLPGLDGYLGILPGHRPLLTAVGKGTITYRKTAKEEHFSIRGGYAEICPDKVYVFTELSEDETHKPTEE